MPSLRAVLAEHDKHHHLTDLPTVLGDGYLYRHNATFRHVRDAVRELGYKFSSDDPYHYRSLRLGALAGILATRVLPYTDTHSCLVAVEQARPGRFTAEEVPTNAQNYLLHESSHCVADFHLPKAGRGPREAVLRLIASEAYALANDSLASHFARPGVHEYMYARNSYQQPENIRGAGKRIEASLDEFGDEGTFRLLYYAALVKQFLPFKAIDRKVLARVIALALPGKTSWNARSLERFRLTLEIHYSGKPEKFTDETAAFFFKLILGTTSLEKALDFDFLSAIAKPGYQAAID
ncbi:MAG TPA: hypothetical protein VM598_08160, partial [Bdellovibrionota bacterium]|nr:hypothetical protein [Bdellovibrionota bacterium]